MSAYRGVRIADFSQGVAGPMAAMFFGDFEAEIVKVEPPGGDVLKDHPGYLAWNRNKQVVTLDLATQADAALALIAGADVAIFDHAPGALEALGLDGATLTAANPGLIHAWMPPFGTEGRWSQLPARHNLITGLTGTAFRQGAYADQPVHLILPIIFYGQAMMAAGAIGSALYERAKSGLGQQVVISGLHGASEVSAPARALLQPPLPRGIPPGGNPKYRLYQCSDGQWFFLGTLFNYFYKRALDVVGYGDLFDILEADQIAAREMLIETFKTKPRDEWLALLQANDVPCAAVGTREDWFAGETVRIAGLRQVLKHETLGDVAMPTPPARMSGTPASIRALPRAADALPAWAARPTASGPPSTGGALAGVRVLNLGTVIAGAYAGTIMANFGADVIKIESPEGDPFRSDNAGFCGYNRGVRGLGLDLKQQVAREVFLDLARDADVVIDNYRLGVRGRLGIDYAALKAINPRIISCSINAYGETGPRAALPGFDPLMQAEGGMMASQGGADDPILYTPAVNDVATAGLVAAACIAALNARERTGEGQEILSSLASQSLLFQIGEVVDYAGRPPNHTGAVDCLGVRALTRYYECADGWLGISCVTSAEAAGLSKALDIDLGPDPLGAPRDGELAARLEVAFKGRPRAATLDALLDAGAPATPALRNAEALEDSWLSANHFNQPWEHPRLGPMIGVTGFADFRRTPGGFHRPTPEVGEHSRELLQEAGFDPKRIEALFGSGAVFSLMDQLMAAQ